ncbi:uncharacterized protein LOC134250118 [Saccostrea cucullata]|uniref:uncharacterized protein LOC134250118 n=1 Tax=Saccostrea cuccullata TaxID=36930 RepID=UPI002ED5D81C
MKSIWLLIFSMFGLQHVACMSNGSISDLQEEMASMKDIIQNQSEETKQQLSALQQQLSLLEKENSRKNKELDALQRNLRDVCKELESIDKRRMRSSTVTVAFHSCISHDVNYLGRKQTIVFDRVITDTHSRYARNSGTYRIPRTGYYVLTWVTPVVGNIPMELIVNGEQRGRTDPSNTGNGASHSTTGIAVLSLYENDDIYIRTHPGTSPTGVLVSNTWQDACFSVWSI